MSSTDINKAERPERPDFGRWFVQWIGLRENLQETIDFPMKIMGLKPVKFPLIQSIDLLEMSKIRASKIGFSTSRIFNLKFRCLMMSWRFVTLSLSSLQRHERRIAGVWGPDFCASKFWDAADLIHPLSFRCLLQSHFHPYCNDNLGCWFTLLVSIYWHNYIYCIYIILT